MSELWDKFIFGFCKVGFVCWQGEPNWLGWILIGMVTLALIGILIAIVEGLLS